MALTRREMQPFVPKWLNPVPWLLGRAFGRFALADRKPALVPALRTLEQPDQDVGPGGVGVHGPQPHRHASFVPIAGRGLFVGHGQTVDRLAWPLLVTTAQPQAGIACRPFTP